MAARINKRKTLQSYAKIIAGTQIALLLLLLYALSLPIIGGGSVTAIMKLSGYQLTRVTVIASSVKTLASRPIQEHTQATSDLQNALPTWEQIQTALNIGSAALQLPKAVPEDIAQQLSLAQSDFIAVDSAAKIILADTLAHPNVAPDPTEVQIVLDHERPYRIAMNQVVMLWQQHIDSGLLHLVWIEDGLAVVLIGLTMLKYLFVTRGMFRVMERTMP